MGNVILKLLSLKAGFARPVSYGNDVGRLIMIATPHLGSPLADSFENIFDWYSVRTLKEGGGPLNG